MTPKDLFLEGTFWDKFWRPIRSRALWFTPEPPCLANPGTKVWESEVPEHLLAFTHKNQWGLARLRKVEQSEDTEQVV